jgi:hypothetical protein
MDTNFILNWFNYELRTRNIYLLFLQLFVMHPNSFLFRVSFIDILLVLATKQSIFRFFVRFPFHSAT